jgi:hypothetical protein
MKKKYPGQQQQGVQTAGEALIVDQTNHMN